MSKLFYEHITNEILKQSDLRKKEIDIWKKRLKTLAVLGAKIWICNHKECDKVCWNNTISFDNTTDYMRRCEMRAGCINGYCKEHLVLGVNMYKDVIYYGVVVPYSVEYVCRECYQKYLPRMIKHDQ